MFGTTVENVVERARRDSLLASRGPIFTLESPVDTDDTALVVNEAYTHIGVGEMLAVDYELMHVQATDSSTRTVTVIRGFLGSTAASHSANAFIEVAPQFPKAAFLDWATQEILSWGRKLFKVTSSNVAITAGTTHYQLPSVTGTVYGLLDIRLTPTESSSAWWSWTWAGDHWVSADVKLQRGLDGDPTSVELQFLRRPNATTTAVVTLAQAFDLTTFTPATDLVATVGLDASWLDLLEVGIKWRAMSSSVIGRSDWRGANVARAAEEATPLDIVRAAGHLRDLRTTKLSDAMVDLRGTWPWRAR